jgi:bifunctional non-homologous end joining protein LigD
MPAKSKTRLPPALASLPETERSLLRRARPPRSVEPMKATLTERRFSDPDWIFEPKLDGVRCMAFRRGPRVQLFSRTGRSLDNSYPEVAEALAAGPTGDFVVDGEIVAFAGGRTSFETLQRRMQIHDPDAARRTGVAVFYYVFDILHLAGYDLTALPLRTRKAVLRKALSFEGPVHFVSHRNRDGEALFEEACRKGWEGLIAKRADSTYTRKRSRDWLKFKCSNEQEMVIGGFTAPQGARKHFGALLVGHYEGDELRYAGKVGTGFSEATLRDLGAQLRKLEQAEPPFADPPRELPRQARWTAPKLVAQIGFGEWTRDGRLRHPRFLGLRDDKRPREVVREWASA